MIRPIPIVSRKAPCSQRAKGTVHITFAGMSPLRETRSASMCGTHSLPELVGFAGISWRV